MILRLKNNFMSHLDTLQLFEYAILVERYCYVHDEKKKTSISLITKNKFFGT